jgi:hypothetical protein
MPYDVQGSDSRGPGILNSVQDQDEYIGPLYPPGSESVIPNKLVARWGGT